MPTCLSSWLMPSLHWCRRSVGCSQHVAVDSLRLLHSTSVTFCKLQLQSLVFYWKYETHKVFLILGIQIIDCCNIVEKESLCLCNHGSSLGLNPTCWPYNSMMASRRYRFSIEGLLRERTEHLDIFIFSAHHSIVFYFRCSVYWWKGSVRFQCFKILLVNYSVNILSECLCILIDCSQLSKTYYNVLFGSCTGDRHALHIYQWTFRE